MNLMIVSGILVYSSLYIVFVYCVEIFVHIEFYSECSPRGSHFGCTWPVCEVVLVPCVVGAVVVV